MVQIQRMVKHCPPIIIPSRRFINDFLIDELRAVGGRIDPRRSGDTSASADDSVSMPAAEYINVTDDVSQMEEVTSCAALSCGIVVLCLLFFNQAPVD